MTGRSALPVLIAAGAVAGLAAGWFVGPPMAAWAWVGDFFLDALKMVVVPLVMAAMISGIGALGDVRRLGRTGLLTLGYYLATTGLAVALGIALVLAFQPGVGVAIADVAAVPEKVRDASGFGVGDFVRTFVWPNLVDAMARTKLLPLIVFSLLLGAVATTMGERGRRLLELFAALDEAMLRLVALLLWLAPVGVFALVAARMGQAGGAPGVRAMLGSLGVYAATVILGLAIHALVVLPAFLRVLGGRRPVRHAAGLAEALISAFSTASSAATLPVTLRCLKTRCGLRAEAVDFVVPLGATINMDGTALYEAVAAIFIAQAWGIPLGGWELILVFLTATLASIGAAGIPEAGLVTMVIVLEAVGLPLEGIGLILAIDWFLDRCRTTVNVWGDAVGAAVIERRALAGPIAP